MPFTPCHAAAAGPIRRLLPSLPLVPLVLGTMAPDFEYLLRFRLEGELGHDAAGLLLFCLPAGMAAWWAFEAVLRPGLGRLLPAAIAGAVEPRARTGAATAAVLAGAASHVAWDALTHTDGWGIDRRVLQHGSTLAAGIAIGWWAWTRTRRSGPLRWPEGAAPRWTFVLAAAAAGGLVNAYRLPGPGHAIVGGMAAGAWALLLAATVRPTPAAVPPAPSSAPPAPAPRASGSSPGRSSG